MNRALLIEPLLSLLLKTRVAQSLVIVACATADEKRGRVASLRACRNTESHDNFDYSSILSSGTLHAAKGTKRSSNMQVNQANTRFHNPGKLATKALPLLMRCIRE